MLEHSEHPFLEPYSLTREISPCAAFAEAMARPEAAHNLSGSGATPNSLSARREQGSVLGSAPNVSRSAAAIWRSVMDSLHPKPMSVTPRSAIKLGAVAQGPVPSRFLALHTVNQSSHVAYRFPQVRDVRDQARIAREVEEAARVSRGPHLLSIQHQVFDPAGHLWLVTPYTGDVDGVRTLGRLLQEKRDQLSPMETERAIEQLLEGLGSAHTAAALRPGESELSFGAHGALTLDSVLVDRHGSLWIELYGLARALKGDAPASRELVRDEVRSIVEIGYQLLTGLRAESPWIPASRLVRGLDKRWDRWFEHGLDPSRGFDSAQAALAALSATTTPLAALTPTVRVNTVWGRWREPRT